jgi:low temperature requirement protein LtrA
MSSVHYMAHYMNLIITTFSFLRLVSKFKLFFIAMYNYFAHMFKHHLELNKLIELLEWKGNKLLKNIKTSGYQCYHCLRKSKHR